MVWVRWSTIGLILRARRGFGEPKRLYMLVPKGQD